MFKQYIAQVMLNAKTMADALLKKGYTLVSGTEDKDAFYRFYLYKTHIWNLFFYVFLTDYGIRFRIWSNIAFLPLKGCDTIAFELLLYLLQHDLKSVPTGKVHWKLDGG